MVDASLRRIVYAGRGPDVGASCGAAAAKRPRRSWLRGAAL